MERGEGPARTAWAHPRPPGQEGAPEGARSGLTAPGPASRLCPRPGWDQDPGCPEDAQSLWGLPALPGSSSE